MAERKFHLLIKARVGVTRDAYRKLAFSTLAHDTLGIIPLAAGVVTTLRTSAKQNQSGNLLPTPHTYTNKDLAYAATPPPY